MSERMTPMEAEWVQKIRMYEQPVCRACHQPMALSVLRQPSILNRNRAVWGACYMCRTPRCGITITRIRENRNAALAAEQAYKDGMAIQ